MIGDIGAALDGGISSSLSGSLGGSLSGGIAASASAAASAAASASLSAAANLAASANFSAGLSSGLSAGISTSAGIASAPPHPPDIWPLFKFRVEISGLGPLRFQTCGGINATMTETPPAAPPHPTTPPSGGAQPGGKPSSGTTPPAHPITPPQAGQNGAGAQLPSRSWKWDALKLSRGMSADGIPLWNWLMSAVKGNYVLKDVSVILLNEEGEMAMTWNFSKTYPTGWKIPMFDAKESKVVIEELTLAHQGVTVQFG